MKILKKLIVYCVIFSLILNFGQIGKLIKPERARANGTTAIAAWNFDLSSIDPNIDLLGGAQFTENSAGTVHYYGGNPDTGKAYTSNNWNVDEYYQVSLSTIGYKNIKLIFDDAATATTGPEEFKIQYSADGLSFNDLENSATLIPHSFSTTPMSSFDLSMKNELNNNSHLKIRIVVTQAGTADSGNWRIDNIAITGTEIDITPPEVPQNLQATAGDGQVGLSWDSNKEPDLAGYKVKWSTISGDYSDPQKIKLVDKTATSTIIDNLTNDTTYYFVISAYDEVGNESNNSDEKNSTPHDMTAPITTLSLNYPPNGTNNWYKTQPTITLTPNEPATTYYRWDDVTGDFQIGQSPIMPSEGQHKLYYYSVDNHNNTEVPIKSYFFNLDTTAPEAVVQPLPPNIFTKTFSIPYVADDAGSGVDFVNLYYSYSVNGNDSWTYWTQYGGNYATSPITFDTDLANGDGYYDFYIVATDKAGNPQAAPQGDDDEQATTYVKARSIDTPTGFFASVSDNKVNLKWNAVAGATSYEIYRSGSPYVLIATLTSNQTSYTDTGAIAGKDYHYKIIAINAGGYKSEAAVITTSIAKIVAIPEKSTIIQQETEAQPETQIIPEAEAQTITPSEPEEPGKVLGDEKDEQETQNWTPLIVVISILILGIATYMGWKWYAEKGTESTEKKEDRW